MDDKQGGCRGLEPPLVDRAGLRHEAGYELQCEAIYTVYTVTRIHWIWAARLPV